MPANIESIAVVVNKAQNRQVPWWGLGQSFADYASETMTDEEALIRSGLDWKVLGGAPIFRINPATGEFEEIEGYQGIYRETDGKLFTIAGRLYNPFQNEEMIHFGSALVNNFGAKWDSVGALNGGATTFATFRLADVDVEVGGVSSEKMEAYLLVTNSHDGSKAFKAAIVLIRVVCMNTLQAALNSVQASWSLRHVGSLKGRLEDARQSLDLSVKYVQTFDEVAQKLMESEMEIEAINALIEELVPMPEKRGVAQATEKREGLLANILGTPTVPAELRRTKWGVLNGVTEFFEHETEGRFKSSTPVVERRMQATLLGGAVDLARKKTFSILTAS